MKTEIGKPNEVEP